MSKSLTALERLKGQVKSAYNSNFDFGTSEISGTEISMIITEEEKLSKAAFQYSKSIKEICSSLYQVSIIMKKEGSFMDWYSYMGFTKDKVSEILKRQQLFLELPEHEMWIAALSTSAVKEITKKEITEELRLEIAELGLKSIEEIKYWIMDHLSKENSIQIEEGNEVINDIDNDQVLDLFKDLTEEIKNIKNAAKIIIYKKKLPALKKYLKEIENLIEEKELEVSNENNLKLIN